MTVKAKWYIVHVYSGSESKVSQLIEEQASKKGVANKILEIFIPTEEVVEIKSGEKVSVDKKCFPGYILIKMFLDDDIWHLVRGIPRVSGFLGAKGKPTPVSDAEVKRIIDQVKESNVNPKSSVSYEIGDQIRVTDGPFASFTGYVEEVENEKQRLKVSVTIFGRSTPIALDYMQVEKI